MPGIPPTPNNIPLASSLPKVSFRKIPPEEAFLLNVPAGVVESQMVGFGFNDGSAFEKPDHYIRYVEPIESELKKQVEYDMDEQDQEWLEVLNADRRRDGLDSITYETFETILDQLEKEWFDLVKRIPPKVRPGGAADDDQGGGSDEGEDSKCAICDDGECENSNAIVFCDGCNLAVHQDCYGIPYIPEGQWLCRKCTVSPDRAVSCLLCPHEGGAFKQTTTGKWAHLICAMWIPETGVSNPVYMEPIDSIDRIPKARWRLQCYLCRHKAGACIQCDNRTCFTAFHVTCARKAGLLFKTERTRVVSHQPSADSDDSDTETPDVLRACCHKHIPHGMRDQLKINFRRPSGIDDEHSEGSMRGSPFAYPRTREQSIESSKGAPLVSISRRSSLNTNKRTSKSARAYKKSFKSGPPLVPAYIANRVLEYISKVTIRKKQLAVQLIARYWSLKREARRGAPLLKRLHLEPWTASPQNKDQTDAQKGKKLLFLRSLREDLERVRMLVEQVRKREREKLRQAQTIRNTLVEQLLFPYHNDLRTALAKFETLDKYGFFTAPVSRVDVPDYYDIIKEPMDWNTIRTKISDMRYNSIKELKEDVLRVSTNAMTYNKPDTPYHKVAMKVSKLVPEVFDELEKLDAAHLLELRSRALRSKQDEAKDTPAENEATDTPAENKATDPPAEDEATGTPAEAEVTDTPAENEAADTPAEAAATHIPAEEAEVNSVVFEELQTLGLEAPISLIELLRSYDEMSQDEQNDLRQSAYPNHPPPPVKSLPLQTETEETVDSARQDHTQTEKKSPILNLMEDFISQVYVPAPAPEPKKGSKKPSPATSQAGDAAASTKKTKKRKLETVGESTPVAERRSSRRFQSGEVVTEVNDQEAPAIKRPRTVKTQSTEHEASASARQGTEETVQVKGGVGDHDSFLLFNSGWVYPEGTKRNRGTPLKQEVGAPRPRNSSAPEAITKKASAAAPLTDSPVRPRSKTTASATSKSTRRAAPEPSKETPVRTTRKSALANRGSSPLTSADEGKGANAEGEVAAEEASEKQMSASERYNLLRRQRRAREREERLKLEALAAQNDDDIGPAQPAEEPPSARRSVRARASISGVDDTTVRPEPKEAASDTKRVAATPSSERKAAPRNRGPASTPSKVKRDQSDDGSVLPHGTDVWAKVEGHPHFPAKIVADGDEISEEQLSARPDFAPPPRPSAPSSQLSSIVKQLPISASSPLRGSLRSSASKSNSPQPGSRQGDSDNAFWVLVAFYDKAKTWRWLPSYKVVPMHVDEKTDARMLKLPGKHSSAKKNVRHAYEQAKRSA